MKSLNSMKVFVVGTLSIGLFSSTALIPATAQELPRVYDASTAPTTSLSATS